MLFPTLAAVAFFLFLPSGAKGGANRFFRMPFSTIGKVHIKKGIYYTHTHTPFKSLLKYS